MARLKTCGALFRPVGRRHYTVRDHCKRELPLGAFSVNNANPDGLDHICRECKAIENGKDYADNREHRKQSQRAYTAEKRDEISELRRAAHDANPERKREQNRKHREKNRDKLNAGHRDYYRRHRDRDHEKRRAAAKAYYETNRERILEAQRRRRAERKRTGGEADGASPPIDRAQTAAGSLRRPSAFRASTARSDSPGRRHLPRGSADAHAHAGIA
jgi:hypothetical protein